MGKAGRWLRHFLPGGRRDRGSKDKPLVPAPEPDHQASAAWPGTAATTTPASTPGAKEKRRWSFRRPAAASPGSGKDKDKDKDGSRVVAYGGFLEPRVDPDQHAVAVAIATAAAAEAAMVAKQAAAAAFRLSSASAPGSKRAAAVGIEDAAAIKIQAVFRSYLARKALCALRGLVKLQALVRGHLVRRQASHTLRCMQALVAAQNRARVARLRLLEQDDDSKQPLLHRTPRTTPTRRSPHHPRFRHHHHHQNQESEENVKIVEVDTGGEAQYSTPRTTASRRSSCYATPMCRTPSKNELYHHHQKTISPTPSALTDASARSLSGRYDDFSFATARNSPYHHHGDFSSRQHQHQQHQHPLLVPSYMANTESSRAKARSQSAPRQRHSVSSSSSAAAAANEAPCWERQGSGRRRASLEGQQVARGIAAQQRVQRCPSQASAPAAVCPWGARMMDRWSASAHDSECGSTSTVITAATTTYCWSMATDNAGVA